MRAKDYADGFIHMMAQGYIVEDAVRITMISFFEEYNGMVKEASGTQVYNALRQQNDKWGAFARSLPNYAIKEDAFIACLQQIKPKLYDTYIEMGEILKKMRKGR